MMYASGDKNVVILDGGKRTPRVPSIAGSGLGLFGEFAASRLGGFAIEATLKATNLDPSLVNHVFMGNAGQADRDGMYLARHAALDGGVPINVPALTLNRLCGSGAEAIINAARMLILGDHDTQKPFAIAGGAERMAYPHVLFGFESRKIAKWGPITELPRGVVLQDMLLVALFDTHAGMKMAETAELLARQYGITRQECDEFALLSQRRAKEARDEGHFAEEIAPVTIRQNGGTKKVVIEHDLHIRDDVSAEVLAKLRSTFMANGTITAGNASGVVDGAAAMVLCTLVEAEAHDFTPLAYLRGWGYGAVDPKIMGIGPVPATKDALKDAEIKGKDLDWVELNEAFAPQALACIHDFEEMGIDPEIVNPMGGAIALGHPLGATGAVLTLTCAYGLRRTNKKFGAVTMCIGGGQGVTLILENPDA